MLFAKPLVSLLLGVISYCKNLMTIVVGRQSAGRNLLILEGI